MNIASLSSPSVGPQCSYQQSTTAPAVLSKSPVLTILKGLFADRSHTFIVICFGRSSDPVLFLPNRWSRFPRPLWAPCSCSTRLQNSTTACFLTLLLFYWALPLSLVRLLMKPISVPFFSQHLLTAARKLIKGRRKKCGRRKMRRDERSYNCHRHPE